MAEHMMGFQVGSSQSSDRATPQPEDSTETTTSTIGKFIVDDVKLFVSPVKAVVNEFIKQVKR